MDTQAAQLMLYLPRGSVDSAHLGIEIDAGGYKKLRVAGVSAAVHFDNSLNYESDDEIPAPFFLIVDDPGSLTAADVAWFTALLLAGAPRVVRVCERAFPGTLFAVWDLLCAVALHEDGEAPAALMSQLPLKSLQYRCNYGAKPCMVHRQTLASRFASVAAARVIASGWKARSR